MIFYFSKGAKAKATAKEVVQAPMYEEIEIKMENTKIKDDDQCNSPSADIKPKKNIAYETVLYPTII